MRERARIAERKLIRSFTRNVPYSARIVLRNFKSREHAKVWGGRARKMHLALVLRLSATCRPGSTRCFSVTTPHFCMLSSLSGVLSSSCELRRLKGCQAAEMGRAHVVFIPESAVAATYPHSRNNFSIRASVNEPSTR
jgi:hypothetical protein